MRPHGTKSRYVNNGCRCPACTKAQGDGMKPVLAAHRAAMARLKAENADRYATLLAEEKARYGVRATAGRPPSRAKA